MPQNEVFPRPLVKSVIFQITFPNLFFLESRIGEFQVRIMRDFPKSQLLIQRQLLFVSAPGQDSGGISTDAARPPDETKDVTRIWRFQSNQGVILDVSTSSLSLVSDSHKGYDIGPRPWFRDNVASVCQHFIAVTQLPVVNRIGLRYIDECPSSIVACDSHDFRRHYNTAFPLDRFPIESAVEMHCRTAVRRGSHMLRYQETLAADGDECKLEFDFDAWSENVETTQVIAVADELHGIIWDEFRRTIKEPVLRYMRGEKEMVHE